MKRPEGVESTITPSKVSLDETLPRSRESGQQTSVPLAPAGYSLGDVIGRGGMGEVIAAFDERIEREVALKRLRADDPSPDAVARFLREAKVQARLDHPAIVPVHELGTDAEGRPFFTMKRLAGTTLYERLGPGQPIQPLLRAFVDVCFAIELAHTRGVIHRDLKPSNIMLGDYGDVYVLDWGVARVVGTARTSAMFTAVDSFPGETGTGVMLGTPAYMAPEQMRGEDVTAAADVFSLGTILFEILSAEPLHPHDQMISVKSIRTGESPAKRRPDRAIAPELDVLCVAALAADPAARPTARALAERVQRYLDGDRDLERRRAVAVELLETAHAALSSNQPGRRREAAHAAGRALALDPDSPLATQMVMELILEPPTKLPPELEESLAESERVLNRERSYRAMFAFLAFYLWLPFAFILEVQSYPQLVGLFAAATGMALLSALNARSGRVPALILLVGNFALALMFSRLTSVYVVTPMLIAGQILALSTHAWIDDHRWVMVLWVLVACLAPTLLEHYGVLAPTAHMTSDGLLMAGTIVRIHNQAAFVSLVAGQCALAIVIVTYVLAMTRQRRAAQRRAHIQAWHLRQMIPGGSTRLR